MKNPIQAKWLNKLSLLNHAYLKVILIFCIGTTLFLMANHAFAVDLLAGTDADIKDTMQGTGKHWLLWIDGGISLASFAYTKKPIVFFSVLGIALFITALVKLAG